MKKVSDLLIIFPIFFVGGVIFFALGALSEELPRFFNWTDSLPLWGNWIIYIIFGSSTTILYKKLLEPKKKK
jgi:hypothetical protein